MIRRSLAILATAVTLGSCGGPDYAADSVSSGCTVLDGKADRRCTPGVANPLVRDDVSRDDPRSIYRTICAPAPPPGELSWIAKQRPPTAYTTALKRKQIIDYHLPGTVADYKEDHLIALEIGGVPRDPRNLFPQPNTAAHTKDTHSENPLHADVCAGRTRLADAQSQMVQQWTH